MIGKGHLALPAFLNSPPATLPSLLFYPGPVGLCCFSNIHLCSCPGASTQNAQPLAWTLITSLGPLPRSHLLIRLAPLSHCFSFVFLNVPTWDDLIYLFTCCLSSPGDGDCPQGLGPVLSISHTWGPDTWSAFCECFLNEWLLTHRTISPQAERLPAYGGWQPIWEQAQVSDQPGCFCPAEHETDRCILCTPLYGDLGLHLHVQLGWAARAHGHYQAPMSTPLEITRSCPRCSPALVLR